MNKSLLFVMITIGSIIGGWIPSLWHAGEFSAWGLIFGAVGAVAGVFVAAWISNNYLDA